MDWCMYGIMLKALNHIGILSKYHKLTPDLLPLINGCTKEGMNLRYVIFASNQIQFALTIFVYGYTIFMTIILYLRFLVTLKIFQKMAQILDICQPFTKHLFSVAENPRNGQVLLQCGVGMIILLHGDQKPVAI